MIVSLRTRGLRVATAFACVGAVLFAGSAAGQALAADGPGQSWTPFFDSGPLEGSGWAGCPEPIRVSFDDVTRIPPKKAKVVVQAIKAAGALWSQATGLTFLADGFIPMVYDDRTGVTSPADGVEQARHVYFSFVKDSDSGLFNKRLVGLAAPTHVDQANREITAATVTFELDYILKASKAEITNVIAHEFGHALGLGHSADKRDVMYPIVSAKKRLGPGDRAGLQTLMRPCLATDASRDYPVPV